MFTQGQIIILSLLFLASMNFLSNSFYYIYIAFVVLLMMKYRRIRFDGLFIIVLLFSCSYILFTLSVQTSILNIFRYLSYPMCYLIGYNLLTKQPRPILKKYKEELQIYTSIIVVGMGSFVHFVLNYIINFNSIDRNTIDVWSGKIMSATGQAALATIAIGIFIALFFIDKRKNVRVIAILSLAIIFLYNLVLAGRTLVILSVIIFVIAFVFTMKTEGINQRHSIIAMLLLLCTMIIIVYTQDVFEIRSMILGSNLSKRISVLQVARRGRIQYKLEYIALMLDYPWGGNRIRDIVGMYAHDLYLDVYSEGGLFPWFLICMAVFISICKKVKFIRYKNNGNGLKLMIICVEISILAMFWIEPIVQGMPWLLWIYFFYTAMISSILTERREVYSESVTN